jgi:hypothetical protein
LSFRNNEDLNNSSVPIEHDAIIMLGYKYVYDMPPVVYKRWLNTPNLPAVQIPPPHVAKLLDGDGRWWEMAPDSDHLDVRWFGANMNGIINDRPALEKAIQFASPSNVPGGGYSAIRKVFIPSGKLRIKRVETVDNSIYVRGVTIEGNTWDTSIITCQLNTGESLFVFDGGAGIGSAVAHGGMRRLAILNGFGKVGGYAIRVEGGDLMQAYESVFEDLKLSGEGDPEKVQPAGKWEYPFYLNGSYSTSIPQGLRKVSLRNIFLGNPTIHGLGAGSVGDLIIEGTAVYGGTTASNNFYVFGTAAAPAVTANLSNGVQFIGCDVDASLFVYNCEGLNFSGIANNIYFYGGAKGCAFNGARPLSGLTVIGQAGNVINAATW